MNNLNINSYISSIIIDKSSCSNSSKPREKVDRNDSYIPNHNQIIDSYFTSEKSINLENFESSKYCNFIVDEFIITKIINSYYTIK